MTAPDPLPKGSDATTCACGEGAPRSGVWMNYAASHTVEVCEIEDWRTWRWRFCTWLSGAIDRLGGPGRSKPTVTVVRRSDATMEWKAWSDKLRSEEG